jgi:hypothetical protein
VIADPKSSEWEDAILRAAEAGALIPLELQLEVLALEAIKRRDRATRTELEVRARLERTGE